MKLIKSESSTQQAVLKLVTITVRSTKFEFAKENTKKTKTKQPKAILIHTKDSNQLYQ